MSGDVDRVKLPYAASYFKDHNASCNKCKGVSIQRELLLGTRVYNSDYVYFGTRWYHFACFFDVMRERREELNEESIMGMDSLNRDHQETIRTQIDVFNLQLQFDALDLSSFRTEHDMGGRSKCRTCKKSIKEGEAKCYRNSEHHHVECFFRVDIVFTGFLESIEGYDGLNQKAKKALEEAFDWHKSIQNSYPLGKLIGDFQEKLQVNDIEINQFNFVEEEKFKEEEIPDGEQVPFNAPQSTLDTKEEPLENFNHDDQIPISCLPYPMDPKDEGLDEYQIPHVDFAKGGSIMSPMMPRSTESMVADMSLKEGEDVNNEKEDTAKTQREIDQRERDRTFAIERIIGVRGEGRAGEYDEGFINTAGRDELGGYRGEEQQASRYGTSQYGYGTPRGRIRTSRWGPSIPQGGYDIARGGYGPTQGGYRTSRWGYSTPQGGYEIARGGYGTPQGGYGTSRGGKEEKELGQQRGWTAYGRQSGGWKAYGRQTGAWTGYGGQIGGYGGQLGGRGGYATEAVAIGDKKEGETPPLIQID